MQQHIIVPESQHPITSRFKFVGALGVVPGLLLMLAAINLNHESLVQTNKVRNVWSQWMLSSEFECFQILVSQQLPQT